MTEQVIKTTNEDGILNEAVVNLVQTKEGREQLYQQGQINQLRAQGVFKLQGDKKQEIIDRMTNARTTNAPIRTAFDNLNNILGGGFERKNLYIFGGQAGTGKTTFLMNTAFDLAYNGHKVCIISLEMTIEDLLFREMSRQTLNYSQNCHYTFTKLKHEPLERLNGFEALRDALINKIQDNMLFLDPKEAIESEPKSELDFNLLFSAKNIKKLLLKAYEVNNEQPDLIILDYLNILPNEPNLSDLEAQKQNVRELKRLADKLNVPILIISSLNKESQKNRNYGQVSFTGSNEVAYTASACFNLQPFRDNEADKTYSDEDLRLQAAKIQSDLPLMLYCSKSRFGLPSGIYFAFNGAYNYFYPIEEGQAIALRAQIRNPLASGMQPTYSPRQYRN